MSTKIDPKTFSTLMDCSNGQFSMVQNNLNICYPMAGSGSVGKLAGSLFDSIIRSITLRGSVPYDDTGSKKGSIWSNPMMFSDVLASCVKARSIRTSESSFRKHMKELLDGNIFYRFGKSGLYAYTYERHIFSWDCFSKGTAYVYPHTLMKIIRSRTDVWNLFWRVTKQGQPAVMTSMGFGIEFAKFIDGLANRMTPPAKKGCRNFDERENAELYLEEIAEYVNALNPFEGFEEYSSFDINELPATVMEEYLGKCSKGDEVFADIIPVDDGGTAVRRAVRGRSKRRLLGIETHVISKMSEANKLPDFALDPVNNPRHLMSLIERRVKRAKGLPTDPEYVISRNLNIEHNEWTKLRDKLLDANCLSNDFLRDWVDWFVMNKIAPRDIDSRIVFIKELRKTFLVFKAKHTMDTINDERSTIYDDLANRFDGITPVEEFCKKYGYIIVYNFLHDKYGKKEADDVYTSFVERAKSMDEPLRKSLLVSIVRTTRSYSNERGKFDKSYTSVVNGLYALLIENDCDPITLGLHFRNSKSTSEYSFWRKIGHES